MDPGTALAVLTVSGRVLALCYKFISDSRTASADITRVVSEVSSLQTIVERVVNLAKNAEDTQLALLKTLDEPNGALQTCKQALQKLEKLTRLNESSVKRRLFWPIEQRNIKEALQSIERSKSAILLALAQDLAPPILRTESTVNTVASLLVQKTSVELRENIQKWIQSADPTTNQNAARKKRAPNTGDWLLASKDFAVWKADPGHIFWLHGIPGAGKTVLSSATVDHLTSTEEGPLIVYFYFDFSDNQKRDLSHCFRSLIFQIVSAIPLMPEDLLDLYDKCNGTKTPNDDDLTNTFLALLKTSPRGFLILDALDECELDDRRRVCELLGTIKSVSRSNWSIFLTSRPTQDIREDLDHTPTITMSLEHERVDRDIMTYVRSCLAEDKDLKKWSPAVKQDMETELLKKSNGMFRWAACQLDSLRSCKKAKDVRHVLQSLPETLDETYDRIINNVPQRSRADVRTVLMLLAFSCRPMLIEEVAEAIAVDLDNRSFSIDNRLRHPNDILELCSSLVTVTPVGEDLFRILRDEDDFSSLNLSGLMMIQFSHLSVKEYILSERTRGRIPVELQVSETLSHQQIAEMCLIYLLDFHDEGKDSKNDSLEFPFLTYAALYWDSHKSKMTVEDEEERLEPCLRRLFDPDDLTSLIHFLGVYDPSSSLTDRLRHRGMSAPVKSKDHRSRPRGQDGIAEPIFYASFYGLQRASEAFLRKPRNGQLEKILASGLEGAAVGNQLNLLRWFQVKGADANGPEWIIRPPLTAAAYHGNRDAVSFLLQAGADPNIKYRDEAQPIHAASISGNTEVIQLLIDYGAETDAVSTTFGLPISAAAEFGNDAAVALLAREGGDSNLLSSALIQACKHAGPASVLTLLDVGADVDHIDFHGDAPLYLAAERGEVSIIRLLLRRGADVNIKAGIYGSPLQASIYSKDMQAFQILLESGANINVLDGYTGSAIGQAIFSYNLPALKMLLDLNASFTEQALIESIGQGLLLTARSLLERGVDPNAENQSGSSALQLAIRGLVLDIIPDLLRWGADPDHIGGEYGTALQAAASSGQEQIVLQLLEAGACVNVRKCGQFGGALQAAILGNYTAIADLLISRGADVNAEGEEWGPPLQCAASTGNLQLARRLLMNGARIDAVGPPPRGTALIAACSHGYESITKLLIEKGPDVNINPERSPDAVSSEFSEYEFRSAIEAAISSNNASLVKILLDRGANINSTGCLWRAVDSEGFDMLELAYKHGMDIVKFGNHALRCALDRKNLDKVKWLLEHGAEVKNGPQTTSGLLQTAINPSGCGRTTRLQMVQILIEAGADIDEMYGLYGSPLQHAIQVGDKAVALTLLERGAAVNQYGGQWGSALATAIVHGDEEMFHLLLDRGANVNGGVGNWGTPLQTAIGNRYPRMTRELLDRGALVNPENANGSPLISAVYGSLDMLKTLVALDADLEATNEFHGTALQKACAAGRLENVIFLLDAGANINARAGNAGGPLNAAITAQEYDIVKLLLDRHAEVNFVGGEYGSPLQAAAATFSRAADLLLQTGCDVNLQGGVYGTALQAAAAHWSCKTALTAQLLQLGAKWDTNVGKYGSSLHAAAKRGNVRIVELLIQHGADVNMMSGKYGTPLQAAACCSKEREAGALELLLSHGASVNARGGKYNSALQAAAVHKLEYVQILLKHGANVAAEGGKFGSPLKAAQAKGHYRAEKLLRSKHPIAV